MNNIQSLLDEYGYITLSEYACHHCGQIPKNAHPFIIKAVTELFNTFTAIREKVGKPLHITSGYRCPQYIFWMMFDEGKSHLHSAHMYGVALDIAIPFGFMKEQFVKLIREINQDIRIGYKNYHGFIHIDTAYILRELGGDIWELKNMDWVLKYWHRGAEW